MSSVVPPHGVLRTALIVLLLLVLAPAEPPTTAASLPGVTWRHFTTADGLSDNVISALALDAGGTLWAGTPEHGVNRFDGKRWSPPEGGPADETVLALLGDAGVWVGHVGSGVSHFDGATWSGLDSADGLLNDTVTAIAAGNDGHWFGHGLFGTLGQGGGLTWFDSDGATTWHDIGTLESRSVTALVPEGDGVWVGVGHAPGYDGIHPGGVARLADGAWTVYTVADGLADANVHALLHDGRSLWVGTDYGVSRLTGSVWQSYLPGRAVRALAVGRGILWVGTDNGVYASNGTGWLHLGAADGLPSDHVTAIVVDSAGVVWFGTDAGIGVLSGADVILPPEPSAGHLAYLTLIAHK